MFRSLMFVPAFLLAMSASVFAAPSTPDSEADVEAKALAAAEAQIEQALKDLNAFYKVQTNDSGRNAFVVMWENGSVTSRVLIRVRRIGTSRNQPVFAYVASAVVAETEHGEPFSPAVIKRVVTENDFVFLGFYSMSEEFDAIYSVATGTVAEVNANSLWMTLAFVTSHVGDFNKVIAELSTAGE